MKTTKYIVHSHSWSLNVLGTYDNVHGWLGESRYTWIVKRTATLPSGVACNINCLNWTIKAAAALLIAINNAIHKTGLT